MFHDVTHSVMMSYWMWCHIEWYDVKMYSKVPHYVEWYIEIDIMSYAKVWGFLHPINQSSYLLSLAFFTLFNAQNYKPALWLKNPKLYIYTLFEVSCNLIWLGWGNYHFYSLLDVIGRRHLARMASRPICNCFGTTAIYLCDCRL